MNIINEEYISSTGEGSQYWKKIIQSGEDRLLKNEKLVEDTFKLLEDMKIKILAYENMIDDLERRVDFLRKSHIRIDIDRFEKEN